MYFQCTHNESTKIHSKQRERKTTTTKADSVTINDLYFSPMIKCVYTRVIRWFCFYAARKEEERWCDYDVLSNVREYWLNPSQQCSKMMMMICCVRLAICIHHTVCSIHIYSIHRQRCVHTQRKVTKYDIHSFIHSESVLGFFHFLFFSYFLTFSVLILIQRYVRIGGNPYTQQHPSTTTMMTKRKIYAL